jgi:PKD domain
MRRSLLTCVMVLALAPTSAQAAGWVTGPALSPPDKIAADAQVAVTPSGERIVAWEQQTTDPSSNPEGIAVRIAPPGGDFGPEQLILSDAEAPTLTVGADGTAAIAWIAFAAHAELHIARRAPGQAGFTEVSPLDLGAGVGVESVAVSVRDGVVYVAYETRFDTANETFNSEIRAARVDPSSTTIQPLAGGAANGAIATASWSEANNNFLEDNVENPSIAVAGGQIIVAFEELVDGSPNSHTNVDLAKRPLAGAGPFGPPLAVDTVSQANTTRAEPTSARIVTNGDRALLVWQRFGSAAQIAFTDPLGGATQTTPLPSTAFNLIPGLDPAGSLVVGWTQFSATVFAESAVAELVSPAGVGAPPVFLSPANTVDTASALSVAPDGGALLVFDRRIDNSTVATIDVRAGFRAPGGGFGAAEEISGLRDRSGNVTFDTPAGAVGAGGVAVAAWTATDPSIPNPNNRLFVSQRDATPPVLGALSIPATVAPGTTVAMAAAASDSQSGVSVQWDFGDGSSASGATVSHAYGATGTYTATVTATDGVGNVATRSATVNVANPATAPPRDDQTPPVVGALKASHTRFRVGAAATATIARLGHVARSHRQKRKVAKKAPSPAGTTFALTLSERATVVLTIAPKAKASTSLATLIRTRRGPGAVSIPFSGRAGATRLAPGSYTLSVIAIDAAGNRSKSRSLTFTVVSR